MTDHKKLVELIQTAPVGYKKTFGGIYRKDLAENIATHLIANGVTVKTPKKDKPPTDLTGKCGSCAHAVPRTAFGGSGCYVVCTHPQRRHVKHIDYPRQRTCKACKMYQPLPAPVKEGTHEAST